MASTDSDVPKSVPLSPAAPSTSTSGSTASSAHRSCLRCARWMSSLKYDKHTVLLVGIPSVQWMLGAIPGL